MCIRKNKQEHGIHEYEKEELACNTRQKPAGHRERDDETTKQPRAREKKRNSTVGDPGIDPEERFNPISVVLRTRSARAREREKRIEKGLRGRGVE